MTTSSNASIKMPFKTRIYSIDVYLTLAILLILYNSSQFCHASESTEEHKVENTTSAEAKTTVGDRRVHFKEENYREASYIPDKPDVVMPAIEKHTGTIIFLHGLGDTGNGWAYTLAHIRKHHIKLICPNANQSPVQLVSGGTRIMPSWFDKGADNSTHENPEELLKTTYYVHSLIDREIADGIKPNRIIVGGFSQGGAVAINAALTYPKRLAGLVALSAWIPLAKTLNKRFNPVQKNVPILQLHGEKDPMVKIQVGEMTSKALKTLSKNVDFKSYKGVEHNVSKEGMIDLKKWINDILS